MLVLEIERGRDVVWDLHLEWQLIHSWLKNLIRNLENILLEPKKVVFVLLYFGFRNLLAEYCLRMVAL